MRTRAKVHLRLARSVGKARPAIHDGEVGVLQGHVDTQENTTKNGAIPIEQQRGGSAPNSRRGACCNDRLLLGRASG